MTDQKKATRERLDVWARNKEWFELAIGAHGTPMEPKEIAQKYGTTAHHVREGLQRHLKKLNPDAEKILLKEELRKYQVENWPCDICTNRICEKVNKMTWECPKIKKYLSKVEPPRSFGKATISLNVHEIDKIYNTNQDEDE